MFGLLEVILAAVLALGTVPATTTPAAGARPTRSTAATKLVKPKPAPAKPAPAKPRVVKPKSCAPGKVYDRWMGRCRWKSSGEVQAERIQREKAAGHREFYRCLDSGSRWDTDEQRCSDRIGNGGTDRRSTTEKRRQSSAQSGRAKCDKAAGYWNGSRCVFD